MKKVIACIDGTEVSEAVCDYSAWASLRMDAPLEFLHVLEKSEYPEQANLSGNIGLGSREALLNELATLDEKRAKLALEQGKLMLEAAKLRAIRDCVGYPTSVQRHGNLVETLVEMEESIRLLVLGKHNEHLGPHVGSRLENVVRTMHQPILITTAEYTPPQSVMLAFDGSATTRKGVKMVANSPLFQNIPCHLVMVGDDTEFNREQLHWAGTTLEKAGFFAPTTLSTGDVEKVLCDYHTSHDIDMLIMGAYGHTVVRRFLVGSITTNVILHTSVPVLLLR
ncbi:MAG: universal stress protein [Candidatus Thiodiazotropha sp.]